MIILLRLGRKEMADDESQVRAPKGAFHRTKSDGSR